MPGLVTSSVAMTTTSVKDSSFDLLSVRTIETSLCGGAGFITFFFDFFPLEPILNVPEWKPVCQLNKQCTLNVLKSVERE